MMVDRLRLALSLLACKASVPLSTPSAHFCLFVCLVRVEGLQPSPRVPRTRMLCHYTIPGEKTFGEPGRIRTFDPLLKRQVPSSILATGPLRDLWSGRRESNSQPQVWRTCALCQLSYSRVLELVRRERLELSIRRLRGDCFTRLAYGARTNCLTFARFLEIGGADEL